MFSRENTGHIRAKVVSASRERERDCILAFVTPRGAFSSFSSGSFSPHNRKVCFRRSSGFKYIILASRDSLELNHSWDYEIHEDRAYSSLFSLCFAAFSLFGRLVLHTTARNLSSLSVDKRVHPRRDMA